MGGNQSEESQSRKEGSSQEGSSHEENNRQETSCGEGEGSCPGECHPGLTGSRFILRLAGTKSPGLFRPGLSASCTRPYNPQNRLLVTATQRFSAPDRKREAWRYR